MYFRPAEIIEVVKKLQEGKIGVFPFDTIWGLTGVMNRQVVERINALKQRKITKPFILLLPDITEIGRYADVPKHAQHLLRDYWPGEVTFIFKKKDTVPDIVTNNLPTVGIRVPRFWPLIYLLAELGEPIISTSVNITSQVPEISIEDIDADILKKVDFVYQDVEPGLGEPSAIIDCTRENACYLIRKNSVCSSLGTK
ncbi:L-threonylcarbamoyladenylate synthase [Candidatus Margulisiibacteriota bacterium]